MSKYITLQKESSDFFIEKKSRFIGYARPVSSEEDALAFIAEIKKKHYDATHNVYAYIIRENGLMRFSDDGEPQGTAGIPVLEAMKKSQLTDAVIVATRYFGGTMLGGGGLIRAYSHTASIAMAAAGKICMKECVVVSAFCDYTFYGRLNSLIPECGGSIENTLFMENVEIQFHIEPELLPGLEQKWADISNGQVQSEIIETNYFPFPIEIE